MQLTLISNWKKVLFGSWSSRLGFAATILGALDAILPAFEPAMTKDLFAIATVLVTALIPVVRVIQQQELSEEQDVSKPVATNG